MGKGEADIRDENFLSENGKGILDRERHTTTVEEADGVFRTEGSATGFWSATGRRCCSRTVTMGLEQSTACVGKPSEVSAVFSPTAQCNKSNNILVACCLFSAPYAQLVKCNCRLSTHSCYDISACPVCLFQPLHN